MPNQASLQVNGDPTLRGDAKSVCIAFNNLTGANFDTEEEHRVYLAEMQRLWSTDLRCGIEEITLIIGSDVVASACIGSKDRFKSIAIEKAALQRT